MDVIAQSVEYFHKGGFVMYLLLACSFLVVVIGVERFLYFKSMDSGKTFARVFCGTLRSDGWTVGIHIAGAPKGDLRQNSVRGSRAKTCQEGYHAFIFGG